MREVKFECERCDRGYPCKLTVTMESNGWKVDTPTKCVYDIVEPDWKECFSGTCYRCGEEKTPEDFEEYDEEICDNCIEAIQEREDMRELKRFDRPEL